MNLAEALDVLPEITTPTKRKRIYTIDPNLVGREHIEEGALVFLAHVPGSTELYRLTPEQWKLAHLFDGQRSYEDIAELFTAETGTLLDAESVRAFAEMMQESGFWYQSPQEKNAALMQRLRDRRKKQKKSKAGDMARITVAHWDVDAWIEIAYRHLKFVYTTWFTALTLLLFFFMSYIFFTKWSQIGPDTLKYYTFTDKSGADLAEFWILFFIMAFFHEGAHAVTCKHYGAGVHSAGFHLIYLSPAFFVDISQVWVYSNRFQRVVTIIAGIWMELIICALATVLWWGTPSGGSIHELAYKIMLITGVAVVLMNLNPLLKLDGYYVMTETTGIADVKERSTEFFSSLVRKYIFGLPVEVPYVRPRLRWFFVPYAILSGLYSYLILYAVARFVGNVSRHYSPEWAFIPTFLMALLIFKSRLIKLSKFLQTVYADKRDRLNLSLSPTRIAIFAILLVALLGVPYLHDTVRSRFILEPAQRALVRAEVPGTVVGVFVHEGEKIEAGAPVLRLRNLDLESQRALTEANLQLARSRNTQAHLQYSDAGGKEQQFLSDRQKSALLAQEVQQLEVRSPIAGSVVSPQPQDLLGSHLNAGDSTVEIADLSSLQARLYLPESDVREVHPGQPVYLRPDSLFGSISGAVAEIALSSSEIEPGLEPKTEYKGLLAPRYYVVTVRGLNSKNTLMDGMTGAAKIQISRRSPAGLFFRTTRDFIRRKIW